MAHQRGRSVEPEPLLFLLDRPLSKSQRQLQDKQLLEGEPPVGRGCAAFERFQICLWLWEVDIRDRGLNRRQLMPGSHGPWQDFLQPDPVLIDESLHQRSDLPRREPPRLMIDGHDPTDVERGVVVLAQHLILRGVHPQVGPSLSTC